MKHDANPYASPRHASGGFLRRPGFHVTLVSSKWLYRCLQVEAPIEAVIEYRGRGIGELVTVNGVAMCRMMDLWWFARLFEFDLETDQAPLPVQVRVRVNLLLRIRGFQLWMDGKMVYEEGRI
ncbi:MAG: hypothetical protein QF918_05780 [Pirellulaceae bacterium]|jgi:hypothetical protein|nr:hypothetical protein [Pirellulaceae bacterium]